MFIQATSVCFKRNAILIMGPAGIGKSALALRLMEKGARLIADDGVEIVKSGRRLLVRAPDAMRGCLEVRGIGIVCGFPCRRQVHLRCVIQLTNEKTERLPTLDNWTQSGISVPLFYLNPSDPLLDLKALTAFRVALGKFSLFSELNMVKQTQIQFFKKRLK